MPTSDARIGIISILALSWRRRVLYCWAAFTIKIIIVGNCKFVFFRLITARKNWRSLPRKRPRWRVKALNLQLIYPLVEKQPSPVSVRECTVQLVNLRGLIFHVFVGQTSVTKKRTHEIQFHACALKLPCVISTHSHVTQCKFFSPQKLLNEAISSITGNFTPSKFTNHMVCMHVCGCVYTHPHLCVELK